MSQMNNANRGAVDSTLAHPPPVRKKRRWWLYALIAFGLLAFVAIALIIAALRYRDYLVNTYTETRPKPLAPVDTSRAAMDERKARWTAFAKAVTAGRIEPLSITADDLNLFLIENMPPLKEQVRLQIDAERLQAQFSFPLELSGQRRLKGRYLNGVATLKVTFQDGWLTLSPTSIEANGKPIPRWILTRLQNQNFLQELDRDIQLAELLQSIESIAVTNGVVLVRPAEGR